MAIFGTAILIFRADFIISGIAPEIMLFGGLTAAFFSGFIGLLAVKIGFIVSHFFLSTRRYCEKIREKEEDYSSEPDKSPETQSSEYVPKHHTPLNKEDLS